GLRLQFSPDDFIQVNAGLNQQMVNQALDWLQVNADDTVLDLYAGIGNFTLALAQRAKTVRAVEGVAKMVQQLATNAKLNGLSNVEAYQADLHLSWPKASWNTPEYTKVLLDPARAGAAGATEQIIKLKPAQILYVSCNAATFARDAKILLQSGYRLHKISGVDMFTHTNHLELMALFSRS
ncbi:MAG TPA: 23S rRNA (uracil(1939)-C(5))-methyltransferase RlmD, partial [Rheinheimera sp.]|nr:23S rRNA (uracil(1939)-C(5))-methyltransferase RlmD [Rheinheimera sp.]